MMDPIFSIDTLFDQLGLASTPQAIDAFCQQHRLKPGQPLHEAPFWTAQQAQFLREGIAEDAEWADVIDDLSARLEKRDH